MTENLSEFTELERLLKESEPTTVASPNRRPEAPLAPDKPMIGISWLRSLGFLMLLLGLTVVAVAGHHVFLQNRSLWHSQVGPVDVGGRTIREMRKLLSTFVAEFRRQRMVVLSNEGQYFLVNSQIMPAFDVESTLLEIVHSSRRTDFSQNFGLRLQSLWNGRRYHIPYWFDEARFVNSIIAQIPNLKGRMPIDATVKLDRRYFVTVAGRDGFSFDEGQVLKAYRSMLDSLHLSDLVVDVYPKAADIDWDMANTARRKAERIVRRILTMAYSYDGYNYDTWKLPLRDVREWVEFRKIKELENYNLYPVLNTEKLRNHLQVRIAKYLYLPKEDIVVKNDRGKPLIEGVAKDGYYLDVAHSVADINDSLRLETIDTSSNYMVLLRVAHLAGGVANPDNEFGITDVLATGVTDFFGSPENRKFNIKHAAMQFHNVILQPGEKFSFIRYMGKVDSANGYMKELVIVNGDSLEPQYGGGICQVSSTLFRTVFFAGLKVLNRVNHSFEVKYYRPVGLDATIFDPYPDLKFQNDTDHLLVVQNFVDIKRTKMYFKLIGKKDGRRMRFEGPTYEGIVGEKQEHYKYSWVRYIDFPDGTSRKDKFGSVYRNRELVKQYQPENLLVMKDSVFVPVSLDTTKLAPPGLEESIRN